MAGRRKNKNYDELGYELIRINNKHAAFCNICKKNLLNTAESRLRAHSKDEIVESPTVANQKMVAVDISASLKFGKFKQRCTICEQRFISKVQLERHLQSAHIPSIPRFICTACNETIKKSNDIKNHQLWHKLSKTPFICGLCGEHLLSMYAYSKHLRDHTPETPTDLLVLDRECPQCQQTFATNFLYNTHHCSVNTKRCAGCNRLQRNETEFLRHAALCSKVYINYSKHILTPAVAQESNVLIKNENDVEAAEVAEALARTSGASLHMTPVVSLTRLTTPMLMNANQCVIIPRSFEIEQTPTSNMVRKSTKKGVSRKDLKRVDDLLKSTMDTLVSIKHEPEMNMDTDMPLVAEGIANSDSHNNDPMNIQEIPSRGDDFHADDVHEELPSEGITIKQECLDSEKSECTKAAVNIKKENEDLPINKIPVLKLKITKEHGKLNSSIVDENSKGEKKKKKKKRKDAEKEKVKLAENENSKMHGNTDSEISSVRDATTDESIIRQENWTISESILMPKPGIIRIKQERFEDDVICPMHASNCIEEDQMMSLVMTSIPQAMEFQISSVSSGVDFASNTSGKIDPCLDPMVAPEVEDVKPCLESLNLVLQISNVSGGDDLSHSDLHQKVVIEHSSINKKKYTAKPKKVKNDVVSSSTAKAFKYVNSAIHHQEMESLLPKIVAISSADTSSEDNISTLTDLNKTVFKKERFDAGYGDEMPLIPEMVDENRLIGFIPDAESHESHKAQEYDASNRTGIDLNEEEEYIASIDFNNITIKREKDIEISEFEINESVTNISLAKNRFEPVADTKKLLGNYENNRDHQSDIEDNDYDEEGGIYEDEGEEEEDYDEENQQEVEEEREYRELELPPLLEETEMHDQAVSQKDLDICQEKEPKMKQCGNENFTADSSLNPMSLVITSVVSEAITTEVTTKICENYQEIKKSDDAFDVAIDGIHASNSSVKLPILKLSDKSECDLKTQVEEQNYHSQYSILNTCKITVSNALTSNCLQLKNLENDSKVTNFLGNDADNSKEHESRSLEANIATPSLSIIKDHTVSTADLFKESFTNHFGNTKSPIVTISTPNENVMPFRMSSSDNAHNINQYCSDAILSDGKNLEHIYTGINTLEAKRNVTELNKDANVSLMPENFKNKLNIFDSPEQNCGNQKDNQNINVYMTTSAENTRVEKKYDMTEFTEKSLNVTTFYDKSLSETTERMLQNDAVHEGKLALADQLNHVASEQTTIALPLSVSQIAHSSINTKPLPLIQLHPYLEDISSSSSGNFESSKLPKTSAILSAEASCLSTLIRSEGVGDFANEDTNGSNLLVDQCNINEIAENNNNANIERELIDDSLNGSIELGYED